MTNRTDPYRDGDAPPCDVKTKWKHKVHARFPKTSTFVVANVIGLGFLLAMSAIVGLVILTVQLGWHVALRAAGGDKGILFQWIACIGFFICMVIPAVCNSYVPARKWLTK